MSNEQYSEVIALQKSAAEAYAIAMAEPSLRERTGKQQVAARAFQAIEAARKAAGL